MRILIFLTIFLLNFAFCAKFSDFSGKDIALCPNAHTALNMGGKELVYCDLGELALHMMSEDIMFSFIKARSYQDGQMISDAFYVLKDGELLAFSTKEEALKFSSDVLKIDSAFDKAFELKSSYIKSLKYKNLKKYHPMGKRIYQKRCPEILLSNFAFISELKTEVLSKCTNLDDRLAQLVSEFLWADLSGEVLKFSPHQDEKCPVCGMFAYKYPRWVAVFGELDDSDRLVFDGVKDAMKFYFNHEKYGFKEFKFKKGYVTDYYTGNMIDLKDAFYVVGSDVLGPMGDELIPFLNESDARAFKLEHRGKDIFRFDEIDSCVMMRVEGKSCE